MRLAIVFTCFNRKNKTKNCLDRLIYSKEICAYKPEIHFFVCDDCSNDGTVEMLNEYKDYGDVITGTGNLFWAKGMGRALEAAKNWNPDFYIMVNDDVEFENNVLEIMLNNYFMYSGKMHAIVGATRDRITGEFTYGGHLWNWKAYPKRITPVLPSDSNKECNTTNWNCFLISDQLFNKVGDIDTVYEHSYADFDYSNRITLLKYKIYTADKYIGFCSRNGDKGTWRDKKLTVKERFRLLNRPNGFPPKSNWHYAKKYYGIWAPYMFVRPYLSILKGGIDKFLRRN